MRLWIQKCVIWLFCSLAVWLLIEHYAGNELNDYNKKLEVLKRCQVDSLVLGSSHSFYGILANHSGNGGSYNMSWSSQTLDETGCIAQQIPDSIHLLICISPFSLSTTINDRVEVWRNVFFNRTFGRISSRSSELSFLLSLGGRKTFRMAQNGFNGVGPSRIDKHGNGSRTSRGIDFENSAIAAYHRHFRRPNHSKLKKTLILLSRRPNTTFFTPPFHAAYQKLIAAETNWTSTLWLLDSLKQSSQVTYADYSQWDMPDSCFYDADHLNTLGQRQFTKTLFSRMITGENSDCHALQQP